MSWLAAILTLAGSAAAQPPAPPEPSETLGLDPIRTRMTVPISIGEAGPFRFIVDTGSERTVVSRELAESLRLAPGPVATVHSVTEVSRMPTAILPGLRVGRRTVDDIAAPTMAARTLGADGLLGVDSLAAQRVELDFTTNEMRVGPSRGRREPRDGDTIVVTARSRLGRLILVDAAFDGERLWVILDTGAQVSIANQALRRRLERRRRLGPLVPIEIVSVTGGRMILDYGVARRVRIGTAAIANLPVGFADVAPFRKLDLLDRPAILLGMDALQLFDRVSMDFVTREVRLELARPGRRPAAP